MSLETVAKIALGLGVTLLVLGGILYLVSKLGWTRLPGDFVYRGKSVIVYVPIGLMILISLIATLIFNILGRK